MKSCVLCYRRKICGEVNENQEIVAGYQKNNFEETLIFHEENLSDHL